MPEIKVKGNVQQLQKKEKNKKEHVSNFLLTINTNQSYNENDPNLQNDIEVFEESIKDVLGNINNYLKFKNGEWNDDDVKDVSIDYVIEVGGKKRMIHAHILLKFKHVINIQLDVNKIKDKIKNELGLKNIYIDNKLLKKDSTTNVLEYIKKYT